MLVAALMCLTGWLCNMCRQPSAIQSGSCLQMGWPGHHMQWICQHRACSCRVAPASRLLRLSISSRVAFQLCSDWSNAFPTVRCLISFMFCQRPGPLLLPKKEAELVLLLKESGRLSAQRSNA